jgi:myo-inositol-1(or 4)-monophosphatase
MENKFTLAELETICKKTIEVTKEAGAFLKKEAQNFDLSKIEYKGSKDLVSYVDKQSEQMLVKGLRGVLPEAGFITEEATVERSAEIALQWVIDPLDGTTNFLHGQPSYYYSWSGLRTKP